MAAVSYEQAVQEINGWLDAKKIKPKKREAFSDAIENLVSAVSEGALEVCEDMVLKQTLSFPVKDSNGNVVFETLDYKPRLTLYERQECAKNVKVGDADGRIMAHAVALTGKAAGLLGKLDTEDGTILQSVTVFFM